MARQVRCVNNRESENPDERILHIGGVDDGVRWKRTQAQAIGEVEAAATSYFVALSGGNSAWVIVRTTEQGNRYLTTQADDASQDTLLALPKCP